MKEVRSLLYAMLALLVFAIVVRWPRSTPPAIRRFDSVMADTSRFEAEVKVIHDTVNIYVQQAGDHAERADYWKAVADSLIRHDSLRGETQLTVDTRSVPLAAYQALDSAYHERTEEVGAVRGALALALVRGDLLAQRLHDERSVAVDVRNLVAKPSLLGQLKQRCGVIAGADFRGPVIGLGCRAWP